MGLLKILIGAAEVAGGIALDYFGQPEYGNSLILAGAGQLLSATLGSGPVKGFATTRRDPIAAWEVCYGEVRQGGVTVHLFTWGTNNAALDIVMCLACHPIDSVTELLFNQERIQINELYLPQRPGGWTGNIPMPGSGSSFSPQIPQPTLCSVQRDSHGLVTCHVPRNIPYLSAGDHVYISNVVVDHTLNSSFVVQEVISQFFGTPGSITFTFLSGGAASGVAVSAKVQPIWANVGNNVYVEYLLGKQTLGETFNGALFGTPYKPSGPGAGGNYNISPLSPQDLGNKTDFWGFFTFGALQGSGYLPVQNPWGQFGSFTGKSAAMLRLIYDPKIFNFGIPQIAFKVRGLNSIYDPRRGLFTDPTTHIFTQNAALVIADFLTNPVWGFKLQYGVDIPLTELSASADACDVAVTLANGLTEPRYQINGKFDTSQKRGEVLTDLLSACAGRLTVQGGQYIIHVGVWAGDPTVTLDMSQLAGPIRWRTSGSIQDHFNACKGTFVSPDAKFTSTDFPCYMEDANHGWSDFVTGDVLLTQDNDERRYMELHLPFVTSVSQAQRLAKIALLRSRYSGTGTLILNSAGYQYSPLDVIKATIPALGWVNKVLEITSTRLTFNDSGGTGVALGCELDVRETDSSVYVWSVFEEQSSEDWQLLQYPKGIVIQPFPYPWSPGYAVPLDGDAIYLNGHLGLASFGVTPSYAVDAQQKAQITLAITGVPAINDLDYAVAAPIITCTPSLTGGNLVAGTYVLGLSAHDAGSGFSDSDYIAGSFGPIIIASGTTGSIAVDIRFGTGDDGGTFYMGWWTPAQEHVFHKNIDVTADASSALITDFDESQAGGPDPLIRTYGVYCQQIIHAGSWADTIHSLTSTSITIGCDNMTLNQFAGCTVTLLAKADKTLEIPLINLWIETNVASDPTTHLFTMAIGPNLAGVYPPDLTTILSVGDVVCCRFYPTFTDTSFSDSRMANGFYPTGAAANLEPGNLVCVMSGPDKGDVRTISSVTADGFGNYTIINIASPWTITPNTGDIVNILFPTAAPEYTTGPIYAKAAVAAQVIAAPNVANLADSTWLVRVRTENAEGTSGLDSQTPFREIYLFGESAATSGEYIVPIVAGTATPDASQGANLLILTAATALTDSNGKLYVNVAAPINYSSTTSQYSLWILNVQQDPTTGGGISTWFDPSYILDFAISTPQSPINTQSHVSLKTDSTGQTTPTSALLDQPL